MEFIEKTVVEGRKTRHYYIAGESAKRWKVTAYKTKQNSGRAENYDNEDNWIGDSK